MDETTPMNTVDQAADSANKAIDATKNAANSVLDSAAAKVESWRSNLSPAVGDAMDSLVTYTRAKPLNALAAAAAAGALLSMIFRAGRR